MGEKCRFCDEEPCSGKIEDHCSWCGTSMDPEDDLSDGDRFCTLDCIAENDEWEKKNQKS